MSVKMEGIHPAKRIGKTIYKRWKRFAFCFPRNCIALTTKKPAYHQLTWLPPQARRMSTAISLSRLDESRRLPRAPAHESISRLLVSSHPLLPYLKKRERRLPPRESFQTAECASPSVATSSIRP